MRFILFLLVISLLGCTEREPVQIANLSSLEDITFKKIVRESNTKTSARHSSVPSLVNDGMVSSFAGYDEVKDRHFLRYALAVKGERTEIFTILLDNPLEAFPTDKNVRVVYLQHQLIMIDMDTEESVNYYVNAGRSVNKVPQIGTTNVIGIVAATGPQAKNVDLKSSSCTCDCYTCYDPFCSTASASCSCGGDSQSVTCNEGFTAECTKCEDEQ